MKPTGQIASAFDTGLMDCLRNIEDGELQVSFEGALSLQLAAGANLHCLWLARCENTIPCNLT